MSSGFNEPDFDSAAEVKDRTLWWWAAVGILVIAFLGALFIWGRSDPNVSRVRARHILISFDQNDPADRARALERAQELRQRIVDGESFSKLAKEYSNDNFSANRGGDLFPGEGVARTGRRGFRLDRSHRAGQRSRPDQIRLSHHPGRRPVPFGSRQV